jgi:hypothetical protein
MKYVIAICKVGGSVTILKDVEFSFDKFRVIGKSDTWSGAKKIAHKEIESQINICKKVVYIRKSQFQVSKENLKKRMNEKKKMYKTRNNL